jgi:acetylornithine/N-succinyldiaminopimelate aminotransferase
VITQFNAIMPVALRPKTVFVAGEGSWITDERGNRYLDFVQGWAVNALEHGHPAIVEALRQQTAQLINASPAFYNQPMIELANRLVANSAFDQVFFANSGAEANEGAVKLARKWGAWHRNGAYKIATFEHGLLINAPRPDTLRFMPALTVCEEEIDRMLEILEEILSLGDTSARQKMTDG